MRDPDACATGRDYAQWPLFEGMVGRLLTDIDNRGSGHGRAALARVALGCVLALAAAATMAASAQGAQTASLKTRLLPEKLGASTTISVQLAINGIDGAPVSPLTGFALSLPRGMGLVESTLGLANCKAAALLRSGLSGCPIDSRLGTGHATVELPFASGPIDADAEVTPLITHATPPAVLSALLFINVVTPVFGRLVLPANLDESSKAAAEQLATGPLTPVPLGPEGPDAVVRTLTATVGPRHLTYYKHERSKRGPYKPKGLTLPSRCPRRGFVFAASLSFLDGSHVTARSRVPCPA